MVNGGALHAGCLAGGFCGGTAPGHVGVFALYHHCCCCFPPESLASGTCLLVCLFALMQAWT